MSTDDQRSLLIIHPGGLGDVLLSLSAVAALRRRYGRHRLVLLAQSAIGSLLLTCGVVDQILCSESRDLASLMAGADDVTPSLRHVLRSCDHVVGWLRDPDGILRTTLEELGITRISLGSPMPCKGVHRSKRFLQSLGEPEDGDEWLPHVIVSEQVRQLGVACLQSAGIQKDQDYVVCHPGSGSIHKCVRPQMMAEVIGSLSSKGFVPLIVGGPADEESVRRVMERGLHNIPVIQGQSLETVAGVLAGARLYIGHDSGLTHLAAAMQIPTVAIFGPTDPRQWAPLGSHVSVLTGSSCTCPSWECVRACVDKPCLSVSAGTVTTLCSSLLSRYHSVTKS